MTSRNVLARDALLFLKAADQDDIGQANEIQEPYASDWNQGAPFTVEMVKLVASFASTAQDFGTKPENVFDEIVGAMPEQDRRMARQAADAVLSVHRNESLDRQSAHLRFESADDYSVFWRALWNAGIWLCKRAGQKMGVTSQQIIDAALAEIGKRDLGER